jgi:hypothetical protein
VLQRILDRRVEGVEPVERERLGRTETAAGQGVRAVVRQQAVDEGVELPLREALEARGPFGDELLPERQVPDHRARVGQRDLGP